MGLKLLATLQALHGKCSPPAAAPPALEPPPMPSPPESAAAAEQAEEERAEGADWIDAAVADGFAAEVEEQVTPNSPSPHPHHPPPSGAARQLASAAAPGGGGGSAARGMRVACGRLQRMPRRARLCDGF